MAFFNSTHQTSAARVRAQPPRTAAWATATLLAAAALASLAAAPRAHAAAPEAAHEAAASCPADNGGLSLPAGFCATLFADHLGHARHLVVAADGTVYVNTWSGRYYNNDTPPAGGFLVALKDSTGSGSADQIQRFGDGVAQGSAGGTGIALYGGWLYAEENDRIVRYKLAAGAMVPGGKAETVLSGMPLTGDHPMHPFVIDARGEMFIDMGSATNACQPKNRMPGVPGANPCVEKQTRGGIWHYSALKLDQKFSAAERYATGIRNGEGLAFDAAGRLFATQHGRDQLPENWPALYKATEGPELPSEELVQLKPGADYGWPECYFDGHQQKLVLAPEYGGDGGHTVGLCAGRTPPVAYFPAHWGPNDLLIDTQPKFPAAWREGAFMVFHGSWNRAPAPQDGYNVVFQPLKDGKASGAWRLFADGFAGAEKDPGGALHRPSGMAAAPDGAVFIADDVGGRIWRVSYHGAADAAVSAAAPVKPASSTADGAVPPEGTHADAGRGTAALPVPPGASAEQVALGDRVFHGEVDNGTCAGCHGSNLKGSPVGPNLISGHLQWSDGSVEGIRKTIASGVLAPKNFQGAMPPRGGAPLSDADVQGLAAYIWAMAHAGH